MQIYTLTNEKEKALWANALFIFDTSSILEIYSCVSTAQQSIAGILKHFAERIWIPAQVRYEYIKHHEEVLLKPIAEKYQIPKGFNDDIIKSIEHFLEITKDDYFHPYIDKDSCNEILTLKEELKERIEKVISIQKEQYDKRKKEIKAVKHNDIINSTFMSLPSGNEFSYKELLNIVKEGEFRYRNNIPPGYMDLSLIHI